MSAPTTTRQHPEGLITLREYTCGCVVYLRWSSTTNGYVEADEAGLYCRPDDARYLPRHKSALVQGHATQPTLPGLGGDA